MTRTITEEGKDDLLSRGFSRRQMLRTAILMGGVSALAGFSPAERAALVAALTRIRRNLTVS